MAKLTDLTKLREQVENLQRDADKAAGALEQSLARLHKEFGCKTPEEGRKMLMKLKREEAEAEAAFEKAMASFQKEWDNELA